MKKLSVQGLRRLRRERGLTQKEFAAAIGYSKSYIAKLESGHAKPGYKFLAVARKAVSRWQIS